VLAQLLQEEIVDETDLYVDNLQVSQDVVLGRLPCLLYCTNTYTQRCTSAQHQ
jgi:hypothetical protein